jgi:predicted NACHT family NTPase
MGQEDGDPFAPRRSKIYVQGQDDGRHNEEESSLVDSAEKRDKVSMVFDFDKAKDDPLDNTEISVRSGKRKYKSAVNNSGNFLRVRSNSNASRGFPGVASLSGVSNAINDPTEQFDYFYKIIIIGDERVGKTNFLLRIT